MYYVVEVKEYRMFKSDLKLIEVTDTYEKAKALKDALQAIQEDKCYKVLTELN